MFLFKQKRSCDFPFKFMPQVLIVEKKNGSSADMDIWCKCVQLEKQAALVMRTKRICDLSVSGRGSLSNQRNVILEVVRRSKTWCACKRDSKKLSYAFVDGECVCAFLSFSGDGFEDQFAGCVAAVGARAISPANISLLFECVSRRRSPRAAPEILRCAKRTKKLNERRWQHSL
jgi:hypothetical protein